MRLLFNDVYYSDQRQVEALHHAANIFKILLFYENLLVVLDRVIVTCIK
jgi:hypothetical protein